MGGKLANISADLPSERIASSAMFKALTGGDRITGERKYSDSFEFTLKSDMLGTGERS